VAAWRREGVSGILEVLFESLGTERRGILENLRSPGDLAEADVKFGGDRSLGLSPCQFFEEFPPQGEVFFLRRGENLGQKLVHGLWVSDLAEDLNQIVFHEVIVGKKTAFVKWGVASHKTRALGWGYRLDAKDDPLGCYLLDAKDAPRFVVSLTQKTNRNHLLSPSRKNPL